MGKTMYVWVYRIQSNISRKMDQIITVKAQGKKQFFAILEENIQ